MYPALTVLAQLKDEMTSQPGSALTALPREKQGDRQPTLTTLWVGGVGGMEANLVRREGIAFEEIPAAGIAGVGRDLPKNLWQLSRGYAASRRILRRFQPEVLFFTGGFLAVPVALAARAPGLNFRRPRSLLYVPDIEPGLALKSITRFSDAIAVTAEEALAYFPKHTRVRVTGYPVRPGLRAWAAKSREEARQALGLPSEMPLLLVTGGSRGALSVNQALLRALPDLLKMGLVVHITGERDWPEMEAGWGEISSGLDPEVAARYRAFPYLHAEMGAALAAADLVISRAGASALGEYPLFGLPAVLIPYPHAWRYQQVNARYLESRGAAQIVQDADLTSELLPAVSRLLADLEKLQAMSAAMRSLARPGAGAEIGALLMELAQGPESADHG